jgi:hypothetical protein
MDQTKNGLGAAMKSLQDIVAPAIAKDDPLATEQLRLVIDYLEFVRSRVDYLYHREQFELRHYARMARALSVPATTVDPALAAAIADAAVAADACAGRTAPTDEIRDATAALAAGIRLLVRAAANADAATRKEIETTIVESSVERTAVERAWYLKQGFDQKAAEVSELAPLLAKK